MYAVIKTGGKQHKVKPGDVIEVEYLHGADETLTFQPLLVVDDDGKTHVGKDVQRAVVTAKLLGEQKGEKVKIFKYKNKSGYSRRAGHRQMLTLVEIEDVSLGAAAKRAPAEKAAEPKEPAEATKEPAAEVTESAPEPAAEPANEPVPEAANEPAAGAAEPAVEE